MAAGAAVHAYAKATATTLRVIIFSILALAVLFGGYLVLNAGWIPDWGETITKTPIGDPPQIVTAVISPLGTVILSMPDPNAATWTWEDLIIRIVLFFVFFFAFWEATRAFTFFSNTTSGVIGFGGALIMSLTKIIHHIASLSAFAAGIGAVGIIWVLATGFFAMVVFHTGTGGALRRWAVRRQITVDRLKSEKGWSRVGRGAKGLKEVDNAVTEGESS